MAITFSDLIVVSVLKIHEPALVATNPFSVIGNPASIFQFLLVARMDVGCGANHEKMDMRVCLVAMGATGHDVRPEFVLHEDDHV